MLGGAETSAEDTGTRSREKTTVIPTARARRRRKLRGGTPERVLRPQSTLLKSDEPLQSRPRS